MSELYKKYVSLKVKDCSKYYLFKNGFFYVFLDEDARTMSDVLNLKLGHLNSVVVKCGFPETSLNKYLTYLKALKYDVEVVPFQDSSETTTAEEYIAYSSLKDIAIEFSNINIDDLSISEAFEVLKHFQEKFKYLLGDEVNHNGEN